MRKWNWIISPIFGGKNHNKLKKPPPRKNLWLVVSTDLKNISQIGSFPQVRMKIKNIWNHQPDLFFFPSGHLFDTSQGKKSSCDTSDHGTLRHNTWHSIQGGGPNHLQVGL